MLGWQPIRHIFLLYVLHGGDVVLMVHGHQMSMGMRNMVSGKCQSNAGYACLIFESLGDPLGHVHDVMGKCWRQVIKIGVMRLGNDQHVTVTDGVNVQKSQRQIVFVNKMASNLLFGNAAEQAVVHVR